MEIYDKLIRKSWGGPINGFYGNYFRGKAITMQVSKEKWYLEESMLEPYELDLMASYNADTWEAKTCAVWVSG